MVAGLPGPAVDVAAGMTSTCVALADGRVFCWGGNTSMELGDGTIFAHARPMAVLF
jgi:alpha-tubulin suppressor-like RCC1 family protein